jgi:sugar/nucleoside kinase (ribokinase family)
MSSKAVSILVIGGAVQDTLIRADSVPASVMTGTSTPATLLSSSAGGVGWNIARGLSSLAPAVSVSFNSVVGDDAAGKSLDEQLRRVAETRPNLSVCLRAVPASTTAQYIALLGTDGELAAAAALMRIFDDHLTPSFVREVCSSAASGNGSSLLLVLDGNVPPATFAAAAFDSDVSRAAIVAIDPISTSKVKRLAPVLRRQPNHTRRGRPLVVMKPNVLELHALATALGIPTVATARHERGAGTVVIGSSGHEDEDDEALAAAVVARTVVDVIFCTRGAKGVVIAARVTALAPSPPPVGWWLHEDWSVVTLALPAVALPLGRSIVKVTGAGDAFFSGAIAALVNMAGAAPSGDDLRNAAAGGLQRAVLALTATTASHL